jgi:hypothetical protein
LNASSNSDEVQLDKVDASCWLNVDITNKLVRINNRWSIISVIANYQEISNTATTLNVT